MKFLRASINAWFFCFLIIQSTYGQSILSSKGVGQPFVHPHTRAMGMGGITIAFTNPFTISRINPAGLASLQSTLISIHYFLQINNYRDAEGSASSNYSNLDGFSFAIPFGSGVNFSIGLAPFTRMDYDLSFPKNLANRSYTKSVEGDGGLNTFTFSLCWALRSKFAIGISGHYLFGKFKETWRVEFENTNFISTKDEFIVRNRGIGLTAGLLFRPWSSLTLGAIYTPEIHLNNESETAYVYLPEEETDEGSILFPGSWGIGTTFQIGTGGLVGIEYFKRDWTRLSVNDNRVNGVRDINRISVGGEILANRNPEASFIKRMAFRLGFAYQPYFALDPERNTMTEQWITMGLGIPLYMNVAQIDIALGYGRRGTLSDNELTENLFQLSLSVTGGEKWFVRRY